MDRPLSGPQTHLEVTIMEQISHTEGGAKAHCIRLQSKPMRLLCALVFSTVFVLVLSGAAVFRYSVVIQDGARQTLVFTSSDDPAEILAKESIRLGAHDEYIYTETGDQERAITILRASKVTVHADGETRSVYRTTGTAADALAELGIAVGDEDRINVSLSEPVKRDMTITINRVTHRTAERETLLPFSVTKIPTPTLAKGRSRVLSEGVNGTKRTILTQTLLDGEVIEESVLSEEIVQEPVASQVLVGDPTAPVSELTPDEPILLDANGNPVEYVKKVTGKATAYSALGKRTRLVPGCVAMDLSDFPRGTRLYIKTPDGSFTYGYAEVRDTGTAMIEDLCLVDLFFDTYRESVLFGAKTVDIYVLA